MYFTLYSDKIPVKGRTRSSICDLGRKSFTYVPNALHEILTRFQDRNVKELGKIYKAPLRIRSYLDFLENEGLGFYTEEPEQYPRIPLQWHRPEMILVAELQIADRFEDHHLKVLDELEQLQCKHVEITALDPIPVEELEGLFALFSGSGFRTIDILLPFHPSHPLDRTLELRANTPEFNILVFYGAPKRIRKRDDHLFWTPLGIEELKGKESPPFEHLIVNKEFFLESLEHNPYYNRKVSIDENGNVKNAIEHQRSFGRVGEEALSKIIAKEEFRELWYASNDKVEDVMDWELRYCWFNTHPLQKLENGNYRIIWS